MPVRSRSAWRKSCSMRLPRRMRWPSISTTARAAKLLDLVGWLYDGAALCCGELPGAVAGRLVAPVVGRLGGVATRPRGEAVGGLDGSLGGTCGGGCSDVMFAAKQSSIRSSLCCGGEAKRTRQARGGIAVAVHARLRLGAWSACWQSAVPFVASRPPMACSAMPHARTSLLFRTPLSKPKARRGEAEEGGKPANNYFRFPSTSAVYLTRSTRYSLPYTTPELHRRGTHLSMASRASVPYLRL